MDKIVAIIPARSGSKSVIDKNIKDLAGYPLIAYSIAAALMSRHISRIVVSTDSSQYASIAQKFGGEVPFLRPPNISGDTSGDRDFLLHAISWMRKNEGVVPELWVHLRPTTPLRDPEVIDQAIETFLGNAEASSLRSGHPAPESPMKWFVKKGKYFKSFVDNETSNLPKEMFLQSYVPNGYVDIVRTSIVEKNIEIHGDKILGFVSQVTNEVDSNEEYEYIEYLLTKYGSILTKYLKTVS
ncbi:acylneuraminate cytidylyltransferase family protein [Alphaproteobacteria bacterium]|nr:acylneuraminate cytidylyltransferase family protein [Alphaproteobacteria bacterium]